MNLIDKFKENKKEILKYSAYGVAGIAMFTLLGESEEEKARKPALVDYMIEQTLRKCDVPEYMNGQEEYVQKLEKKLNNVRSNKLDFFVDNKVTICLDKRLGDLKSSFFGKTARTVFYPGETPVVTLRYKNNKIDSYADNLVSKFPLYHKDTQSLYSGDIKAGYSYTTSCGDSCTDRHYKWKDISKFNQLKSNTDLKYPPLAHVNRF